MTAITIRHAGPEDAPALCEIHARPEVYCNTLQIPYPSLATWQQRLASPRPGQRHLVAILADSVVGHLSMETEQSPRRSHVATFGMSVAPDVQHQGIGQALLTAMLDICDNWLPVTRTELTVFADNHAAIGLYRKMGFEQEGIARQYALRAGILTDALFMARLRP